MPRKIALVGGAVAVVALSIAVVAVKMRQDPDPGPAAIPVVSELAAPVFLDPGSATSRTSPAISPKAYVPAEDERASSEGAAPAKAAPRATVTGRVVDERGAPLPSVPVTLRVTDSIEVAGGRTATEFASERRRDAKTGPDGRFTFEELPAKAEIRARARPTSLCDASLVAQIAKTGVTDLGDMVARAGGSIAGTVLGPLGAPVRNGVVKARPEDPGSAAFGIIRFGSDGADDFRSATTNASGQYRIDGLPEGACGVTAESDEHMGQARSAIRVRRNDVTWEVDFKLPAGATVAGVVRDVAGEPLVGATVTASPAELRLDDVDRSYAPRRSATTGADGRFVLSGLGPEACNVRARKPGMASAAQSGVLPGTEVALVLKPTGTVFGRVRNAATNEPIAAFSMKVLPDMFSMGPFEARVLLGADAAKAAGVAEAPGLFAIVDLPETPVRIEVRSDDFAETHVGGVRAQAGDKSEVNVLLAPQAVVRGLVSDSAGRPVAGARVTADRSRTGETEAGAGGMVRSRRVIRRSDAPAPIEDPDVSRSVESGADGAFVIKALPPGDYHVGARLSGYADATPAPVTLKQGDAVDGIKVVLELGGTFGGRALDGDGNPLPGARVGLRPKRRPNPNEDAAPKPVECEPALAGPDGSFEMTGLRPGDYLASLEDPEGENSIRIGFDGGEEDAPDDVSITIEAGRTTRMDLRQKPRATLSGTVREGGKPAPGMRVVLAARGIPILFGQPSTKTDDQGAFVFEKVAPGDYDVSVDPPGAPLPTQKPVTLAPRAEQRITIDLPTGAIEGQVTDSATRKPLTGVTVTTSVEESASGEVPKVTRGVVMTATLDDDEGASIRSISIGGGSTPIKTDEDGRFRLRYLSSGRYKVSIRGAGVTPQARAGVTVEEGRTVKDVDFGAEKGATLLVSVDPAGREVGSVFAFARADAGADEPEPVAGTPKKPLRFAGLKPGRYHVRVDAPMNDLEGSTDVDVPAGQEVRVTVRLGEKQTER